ncbi:MAG: hypothetical protein AAFQ79_03775 [Pseudomonadota bacterium]
MELILLSALLGLGLVIGLVGGDDDGDDSPPPANAGNDVITGTADADRIEAGAGDDIVNALGGNDQLFLGIGSDTANAGEGEDTVFGGGGADNVQGGPGDDRIFLEDGPDQSIGVDLAGIPQDGGNDLIRGGGGNDQLLDRFGMNELFGEEGADTINAVDNTGDNTPDELFGGFGMDTLIGDDGDELTGGERDDTFFGRFDETGEDPITITDYIDATETLTLEFDSATFTTPLSNADLSFNTLTGPDRVEVLVDGTVYAVLEGLTTTPTNVNVAMI